MFSYCDDEADDAVDANDDNDARFDPMLIQFAYKCPAKVNDDVTTQYSVFFTNILEQNDKMNDPFFSACNSRLRSMGLNC